MYDLEGKVALVTGAARQRGIGYAIALRLAREGADVAVTSKHRPSDEFPEWERNSGWLGLDSVAKEIEGLGRRSLAIIADVGKSEEVGEAVKAAVERLGGIDILVNNAAFTVPKRTPVIDLDETTWVRTLTTNLTGPFLFSKAVARVMIAQGREGRIINIASDMAKAARAGTAAYVASKHGLLGLTRAMALELAPHRITVNAVCPGAVMTFPQSGALLKAEAAEWGVSFEEASKRHYDEAAAQTPLGRAATVEDVANVVAFLASSQSAYMTGQGLNVTGGRIIY